MGACACMDMGAGACMDMGAGACMDMGAGAGMGAGASAGASIGKVIITTAKAMWSIVISNNTLEVKLEAKATSSSLCFGTLETESATANLTRLWPSKRSFNRAA
ncbi:hypothetical protein PM082_014468 [Marasmius tenuissimus]|nr:hypothetical protein PM082_014468 [Marasmius tenuissimus]